MKNIIANLKTFEVSYIGATNTQGSRIKIQDFLKNEVKYIPYNYNYNNCMDGAIEFLESKGIEVLYTSESKKGYLLHTNNFSISIKTKQYLINRALRTIYLKVVATLKALINQIKKDGMKNEKIN